MSDYVNTPIYEALTGEEFTKKLRMHMPGHKGRSPYDGEFCDVFHLDATELPVTGDLYAGHGPVREAEQLAASVFGAKNCMFLAGGATQGIMTALALCARGEKILMDRGCHRSVYNAMALLDIKPEYLYPRYMSGFHIAQAINPDTVEEKLSLHKDIKTVVITSPTYYGIISDIGEISYVCKFYGAKLIVDSAHGAHLPFIKPYVNPVSVGAAFAVMSGHKTLPVLTSGAYLFFEEDFSDKEVREAASVFGSSSPGYAVLTSLDMAREYMNRAGRYEYARVCAAVEKLHGEVNKRGVFMTLETDIKNEIVTDPARITLNTSKSGLSGNTAARILSERFDIQCEMSDRHNVVFICTCMDTDEDIEKLGDAVRRLERTFDPDLTPVDLKRYSVPPVRLMTPREAYMTRGRYMPLKSCAGHVSLQNIGLYPPGIPVFARGEIIDELHIEYLSAMRYNTDREIYVK